MGQEEEPRGRGRSPRMGGALDRGGAVGRGRSLWDGRNLGEGEEPRVERSFRDGRSLGALRGASERIGKKVTSEAYPAVLHSERRERSF